MAEEKGVLICDTTLREGGQSMGSSFTPQDMLAIAEKLVEFGVPWIECPWPVPEHEVKEDEEKEALQKALEFYQLVSESEFKGRERLVVFGSTGEKEVEAKDSKRLKALVKTGLKNFAIFGKSSKRHVFEVLKTSLKENLRMIEDSVRFLKKQGGTVFYDAEHFFDGYLEDPEYAYKTVESAIAGGADVIILCDTNGGMLPEQVEMVVCEMSPLLDNQAWGVHMHDDGEFALANTLCAINNGATYAQCTVNGESERVGMPKLTSLLPTLMHKKKIKCFGIDSTKSEKALAEFVAEKNNHALPFNQAYVGPWAFTHKAASHQLGARIDPTLQEHINPNLVGAKRRLPISGEAGRNAVVAALNELGVPVDRDDPAVYKILGQIRNLDKQGFNLESAPSTFALIALRQLENYQRPFEIKLIKSHSTLVWENSAPKKHRSESSIEIVFPDGCVVKPWERGSDGPVDAIKNALKPVLAQKYPFLQAVELIGFKVRIINGNGQGTASKVRVSITGKTPFGFEDTAAVSRNIIKASAMALMDLYEVTILKGQRQA